MTDYGNVSVIDAPFEALDAEPFYQLDIGIRIGSADHMWDLDPKPIPIPPIVGQLWPRGMVGPYIGPAHIPGTAKIFNLNQDVEPPPSIIGQLWPRGDYIPSDPNR